MAASRLLSVAGHITLEGRRYTPRACMGRYLYSRLAFVQASKSTSSLNHIRLVDERARLAITSLLSHHSQHAVDWREPSGKAGS